MSMNRKSPIIRPALAVAPRRFIGEAYARKLEVIGEGAPVALALNKTRFRGELEVLNGEGIGVVALPYVWQNRFLPHFSGQGVALPDWFAARPGTSFDRRRAAYRAAVGKVIGHLHDRHRVGATIGAAVHYIQDIDWGAASQQAGVPYVVFHKENLVMSEGLRKQSVAFYETLGRFPGESIVVHNERMGSVFVDSGFASSEQVKVLGSARLAPFIRSVEEVPPPSQEPLVVLFSFFHASGLMGLVRKSGKFKGVWSKDGETGFVRLFDETHRAVIDYARANPDVQVVIKTKWGGSWFDHIRAAAGDVDIGELPNLTITDSENAQDLMLRARAVVGFASTTLFEAAIAGRRVIVPHFAETTHESLTEFVPFSDDLGIFDVAASPAELGGLITDAIGDAAVGSDVMDARRRAFERYVAPLDPQAAAHYADLLRSVAS